ncbi:unnamed protein product [Rangifer tarandus platyrhynchus]|uniref:Uncharacterized protein n=1 Tax=Rangifer tarandus platyrhynchus TaxID=3082113 RepID=A0AC59ZNF8_RANTA
MVRAIRSSLWHRARGFGDAVPSLGLGQAQPLSIGALHSLTDLASEAPPAAPTTTEQHEHVRDTSHRYSVRPADRPGEGETDVPASETQPASVQPHKPKTAGPGPGALWPASLW